ncbi:MAG: HEAT repeat domain-containing protein [Pseudomonadota bacterium]
MSDQPKTSVLPLVMTFLAGAIGGWLMSQHWPRDQPAEVATLAQAAPQAPVSKESENEVQSSEQSGEDNRPASTADNSVDIEAELSALIYTEIDFHELTADRIIAYLDHILQDPKRRILGEKELRDLIRGIPEINYALLDKLMDVEDERVRSQLEILFMVNNMSQRPFLEPHVMEKIKAGENRSEWLRMMGNWGLQAKSNIAYLLDEMPYYEVPADVGSAIRAITGSSWAQSSALSPAEQRFIGDTVNGYHESEHTDIRAASIAALSSFPGKDLEQRLIQALQDSSDLVRHEAALVYQNNPFPSSEIEALLESTIEPEIESDNQP